MQATGFYEVRFNLFDRYSLFLAARFRNQPVPKILQYRAVFFQIDLNGDLSALLIGDKLDTDHRAIILQAGQRSFLLLGFLPALWGRAFHPAAAFPAGT